MFYCIRIWKTRRIFWEWEKRLCKICNQKVLREFGPATDYVAYQIITEPTAQFKQYKINSEWKDYQELDENEDGFNNISIYGKSLGELVENGKEFELKYIIAKKEKNFYPFLSDLYSNEENYSYMIKIFDSNEFAYKKLKVKVFEIDYEKFNKNNEWLFWDKR